MQKWFEITYVKNSYEKKLDVLHYFYLRPVLERVVPSKKFHGNGKLMLFGEYAVLDGARSLAIPTKRGQSMEVKPHRGSDLIWECYDHNGELWFEAQISLYDFSSIRTSDEATSKHIQKLLKGAVRYNTEFLNNWNGFKVIHRLDFPRNWGLGSSSTVIYNLASWADVNPFHLHFFTSNGSGYDIACAGAEGPLVYQVTDDELSYTEIDFAPHFIDNLYFIHLGKKQSSPEGIKHFMKSAKGRKSLANKITALTDRAIQATKLDEFQAIMDEHEELLSGALQMPTVKSQYFNDFEGSIKSLGAWGGDFIMAATTMTSAEVISYFRDLDYSDIYSYNEMSLAAAPATAAVRA